MEKVGKFHRLIPSPWNTVITEKYAFFKQRKCHTFALKSRSFFGDLPRIKAGGHDGQYTTAKHEIRHCQRYDKRGGHVFA